MAAVTFRRPPRRDPPVLVAGRIDVRPPPVVPERVAGGVSLWLVLLPAVGGLAAVVLLVAAGGTVVQRAAAVLVAASMLAIAGAHLARVGGSRDRQIAGERRDYQRHLAQLRRRARHVAAEQAEASFWLHPDPHGLPSLARTSRLWERRPADADFATLRLGLGDQAIALDLELGEAKPPEDVDVLSAVALRRFLRAHGTVRALPVPLALRSFGRVRIEGDPASARGLAAAAVGQAITWHAPTDLRLALCVDPAGLRAWDWLKWAPHLQDPSSDPTDVPRFTLAADLTELAELLADDLAGRPWATPGGDPLVDRPHILVIVDGGRLGDGGRLAAVNGLQGVTVFDLTGAVPELPSARSLRLRVSAGDLFAVSVDRGGSDIETRIGRRDLLGAGEAATVARAIAGLRMPRADEQEETPVGATGLTDLLGVENLRALDPGTAWRPRPARDRLRVAIGVGTAGQAVELDLKEAAQGGMGPHGLVVGATGSGKSELLRTLVLGLAMTHSPELVNMVLVDVTGGATFTRLDALPHTSAVITNLSDDPGLVDRMTDAISGELNRRMELLHSAGNYASLRDYDEARAGARADLPALPTLLVVVDEFSELLAARPDLLDLFITIGRVGGSLGLHLLLASQRLDEGRLHGLGTYLSYRIGLQTFSVAESRIVLGVPDAFELPNAPGNGYLTSDTTSPVRFQAAHVSGPVPDATAGREAAWLTPQAFRLQPAVTGPGTPAGGAAGPSEPADERTLLDVAVSRLTGAGVPAHEVWLPPLSDPPSLDMVLSPTAVGLDIVPAEPERGLTVPMGWVDRPLEQTRELLTVDLAGAGGHLAVVGAPRSGKSTALRTAIGALSLTHTPEQVQFYCLDFGGGSLGALAGLPHVGSVAGRLQPDLVRGTVATVARVMTRREETFAARGISSLDEWRAQVAAGRLEADGYGDVFLVVDGWAGVREWFEPLEAQLTSMAARGPSCGVHLALSATRWAEIRPSITDLVSSRIELRLADPLDSEVDSRLAAAVPADRPGRGLTRDGLHALTAVPRIDHRATAAGLAAGTAELVRTVRDRWPGPPAPPVRLLPAAGPRPSDQEPR